MIRVVGVPCPSEVSEGKCGVSDYCCDAGRAARRWCSVSTGQPNAVPMARNPGWARWLLLLLEGCPFRVLTSWRAVPCGCSPPGLAVFGGLSLGLAALGCSTSSAAGPAGSCWLARRPRAEQRQAEGTAVQAGIGSTQLVVPPRPQVHFAWSYPGRTTNCMMPGSAVRRQESDLTWCTQSCHCQSWCDGLILHPLPVFTCPKNGAQ